MLITLKEIMNWATENKCAVGSFNTPNLESLQAVLDAAEKLNTPVIISHAQVHEPAMPLKEIGPYMVEAARKASVPVCVHLDHCESLEYMQTALEIGFTGVMYDGSLLPYEENVKNTKIAVAMAEKFGAHVEAEVGKMGAGETGTAQASGPIYTEPDEAAEFSRETGIHALAPSFGTCHGLYKSAPVLDLERVGVISEKTGLPLVMHGGSGVSPDEYRKAIQKGIRKINYYTYMSRAGVNAMKEILAKDGNAYFHDLAAAARKAMQKDVEEAIKVFCALE